jgi:hypothetical protein
MAFTSKIPLYKYWSKPKIERGQEQTDDNMKNQFDFRNKKTDVEQYVLSYLLSFNSVEYLTIDGDDTCGQRRLHWTLCCLLFKIIIGMRDKGLKPENFDKGFVWLWQLQIFQQNHPIALLIFFLSIHLSFFYHSYLVNPTNQQHFKHLGFKKKL